MSLEVYERVRKYRKEKKIHAKDMAKAIGMNNSTYCRMEKEGKRVDIQVIEKIAKVLGIDRDLLLYGEKQYVFTTKKADSVIFKSPERGKSFYDVEEQSTEKKAEETQQDEVPLILRYVCNGDMITTEEMDMIKIFRNSSDENKTMVREMFTKLKGM